MTIAIITHPDCTLHDMGYHHPESPARLTAIQDQLLASGLDFVLQHHDAPLASREQLLRVHDPEYVEHVFLKAPEEGRVWLDPDTCMNQHSLYAALRAAGAVVLGVDLVMSGQNHAAFCNVRPPGHHAERDKAVGFCIFNNIAVGAAHAREEYQLERVAIIDFDVHYGNGTENIFREVPEIQLCSTLENTVARIQENNTVFNRLRAAMRIAQPDASDGLNNNGDTDMNTIKASVTQFRQDEELNQQALTRPVYQKMFKQIDQYWEKLFADPIEVKTPEGYRQIQPQRTNNILEQFFRDIKRSYRKRSGNKSLTKILQTMMVDTPLVKNLNNPNYMKIILNGHADLADRFAEVDIKQVRQALTEEQLTTRSYPKRMRKLFKIPDLLINN